MKNKIKTQKPIVESLLAYANVGKSGYIYLQDLYGSWDDADHDNSSLDTRTIAVFIVPADKKALARISKVENKAIAREARRALTKIGTKSL